MPACAFATKNFINSNFARVKLFFYNTTSTRGQTVPFVFTKLLSELTPTRIQIHPHHLRSFNIANARGHK